MARRPKSERPGFFVRSFYGLLLPIGAVAIIAGMWYFRNIEFYPISRQHQKVPGASQRLLFQSGAVLRSLLVFPTAIGMCMRLILRTRRQSRLTLFIKGSIAAALGTVLGLFLFQLFGRLLADILRN